MVACTSIVCLLIFLVFEIGESFVADNGNYLSQDSSSSLASATRQMESSTFAGFAFEVWGRVQGVFFRKYTEKKARDLGLSGWVRNTARGTVEGQVASDNNAALKDMQHWLRHEGSPHGWIERAEFKNLTEDQAHALQAKGSFRVRSTV